MKDKNGKKVELAQTDDESKVLQYEIFYKELRNNSVPTGGAFSFDKVRLLFFVLLNLYSSMHILLLKYNAIFFS